MATDALEARSWAAASRFPPLLVAAERVAAAVMAGAHGRRRSGPGETFWQYRPLRPGDPASAVDWRQSARGQSLLVRESEWTAVQTVGLWRDGSASMAYRSHADLPQKRERADLLLAALAVMLVRGGERLLLMPDLVAAGSGGSVVSRLIAALPRIPESEGLPPPGRLPPHAEVVLVSDFLLPLEVIERDLRALAASGARGHLVQILDPAEETLPFSGRIRFIGPEQEGELVVRRTETLRQAYIQRLQAHRETVKALARQIGWSFTLHHTDQSVATTLLALHQRLGDGIR